MWVTLFKDVSGSLINCVKESGIIAWRRARVSDRERHGWHSFHSSSIDLLITWCHHSLNAFLSKKTTNAGHHNITNYLNSFSKSEHAHLVPKSAVSITRVILRGRLTEYIDNSALIFGFSLLWGVEAFWILDPRNADYDTQFSIMLLLQMAHFAGKRSRFCQSLSEFPTFFDPPQSVYLSIYITLQSSSRKEQSGKHFKQHCNTSMHLFEFVAKWSKTSQQYQ